MSKSKNADKVVINLSHLNAMNISKSSQQNIVIDVLFHLNEAIHRTKIRGAIMEHFGVEIPSDMLAEIIDRLIDDASIQVNKDGKVCLTVATQSAVEKYRREFLQLQDNALSEWVATLEDAQSISKERLCESAITFLNTVFIQHGLASVNILNNNNNTDVDFELSDITKKIAANYHGELKKKIEVALPNLLHRPFTVDHYDFLEKVLNKSVAYLSCVVSPDLINAIQPLLHDVTIFLDTNIVYRLLNLQGSSRYKTTKDAISLCQKYGMKFSITFDTMMEFNQRIAFDADVIEQYPVPVNLASVGYKYRSSENYVSSFWVATQSTGISAKDFNEKYKHAHLLLKELDIDVLSEPIPIKTDADLQEEANNIFSKIFLYDNNDENQKSNNAAWHDASNIAYVKSRQNQLATNAIEAKYLFLTSDWKLIKMQGKDHYFKNRAPIVLLPTQLVQIVGFINPSNDYYSTFLDLFASSSINYISTQYSNSDVQEVLGRINEYKVHDPDIASKILAGQWMKQRFMETKDDSEKDETVYQRVTEVYKEEISNKEAQLKDSKARLSEATEQLDDYETQLNNSSEKTATLEDEISRLKERIDDIENQKQFMFDKSHETINQLKDLVGEVEDKGNYKIDALRQDYITREWRKWKVGHIILLGIGTASIIMIIVSFIKPFENVMSSFYSNVLTLGHLIQDPENGVFAFIGVLLAIGVPSLAFGIKLFSPGKKLEVKKAYGEQFDADLDERVTHK